MRRSIAICDGDDIHSTHHKLSHFHLNEIYTSHDWPCALVRRGMRILSLSMLSPAHMINSLLWEKLC